MKVAKFVVLGFQSSACKRIVAYHNLYSLKSHRGDCRGFGAYAPNILKIMLKAISRM